jgi:hypothetical protein
MFQELKHSEDVKARLSEILTLVNKMPLDTQEKKLKFAKFLINKYITENKEEKYESDEEKLDEKENIEYIEENGGATSEMYEV